MNPDDEPLSEGDELSRDWFIEQDREDKIDAAADLMRGYRQVRRFPLGEWDVAAEPSGLLWCYHGGELVDVINLDVYGRASRLANLLVDMTNRGPEQGDGIPDTDESRGVY